MVCVDFNFYLYYVANILFLFQIRWISESTVIITTINVCHIIYQTLCFDIVTIYHGKEGYILANNLYNAV